MDYGKLALQKVEDLEQLVAIRAAKFGAFSAQTLVLQLGYSGAAHCKLARMTGGGLLLVRVEGEGGSAVFAGEACIATGEGCYFAAVGAEDCEISVTAKGRVDSVTLTVSGVEATLHASERRLAAVRDGDAIITADAPGGVLTVSVLGGAERKLVRAIDYDVAALGGFVYVIAVCEGGGGEVYKLDSALRPIGYLSLLPRAGVVAIAAVGGRLYAAATDGAGAWAYELSGDLQVAESVFALSSTIIGGVAIAKGADEPILVVGDCGKIFVRALSGDGEAEMRLSVTTEAQILTGGGL